MKKRLLLWSRFVLVAGLILIQFIWLLMVIYRFSYRFTYANYVIRTIAVIVVLCIVNRSMNPNRKLLWTFLILLSPIVGLLLYLIFGRNGIYKNNRQKMDRIKKELFHYLHTTPEVNQAIERQDKVAYRQMKYINDWSGYPVYPEIFTKYYKCGEELLADMLLALEHAEKFIFLEYYIIEQGYMLNCILEVLERKASAGIDIRILYDDMGSIGTVPRNFADLLKGKGIQCETFHPFLPIMSVLINHRDHRKLMVIDGNVGFAGGMNLADEYINQVERYGYWKDTVVCLKGEAVNSLTVMFLSMWEYVGGKGVHTAELLIEANVWKAPMQKENMQSKGQYVERMMTEGYIQPYCDSPFDEEYVGENVYLNIINQAVDYVYIFTPYLIIDNEMLTSLKNAAKRGVDVRIVTPGVPDKQVIYWITQSFYRVLIQSGVKIYQYRPGFLHAKSFLCDDKIATIGSVNLDYRSLYLHFESGVYLYRCKAVEEMKTDYMEVFSCSDEVTIAFCENQSFLIQVFQGVMRLLAPLL